MDLQIARKPEKYWLSMLAIILNILIFAVKTNGIEIVTI